MSFPNAEHGLANMHPTPAATIPSIEPATVVRLLRSATDVAIVMDRAGLIQDVIVAVAVAAPDAWQTHVGHPWQETVTGDSKAKVASMLSECNADGQSRPREINQVLEKGQAAFRFAAVQLDGRSLVAVGRDLAAVSAMHQQMLSAQQAMEREYSRMRQHETRYRILFQLSSEGVVIVDATTLRITEINPAAGVVLEKSAQALGGRPFADVVDPAVSGVVKAALLGVVESGVPASVQVLLRNSGQLVTMSISVSKQGASMALIIRLVPNVRSTSVETQKRQQTMAAIEALPVGFVVLDQQLHVLSANPMFCELAEIGNEKQALGVSIDRWLGRPGIDINVIRNNLQNHGVVHNFSTVIRGSLGLTTSATVSAVSASESDTPCVGLVVHPVGARIASIGTIAPSQARSVEQLRDLVGQVPLKELVRESSELVERMCIEAALNLTSNNRASAAQLLGLSRQGLYSKLRRHGLVA